jgi:supervillin
MLDNEHEVWLWQGWWPDLPDTENSNTGSGKLRLAVERRCAMETVMEYCRLKGDQLDRIPPPAYLVSAGLEPLAFTSLFPYWTADERVAQLNIQVCTQQRAHTNLFMSRDSLSLYRLLAKAGRQMRFTRK